MEISQLPFNQLIGLEKAGNEDGLLVSLPDSPKYGNHLGTVHGSALFAVAEAGSGEFLLRKLGHIKGFVPVVRKVEAKFRKPAHGRVSARCLLEDSVVEGWASELTSRGRLLVSIPMEVIDGTGVLVLSATVEWFIANA